MLWGLVLGGSEAALWMKLWMEWCKSVLLDDALLLSS
jgi:hypothetical protein